MTEILQETPLVAEHAARGARFVPYAGWRMPVQYRGVSEEHHAVRRAVGLFDVSHMGRLVLEGPRAVEVVDGAITNDFSQLEPGRALYTCCCNDSGGILDDLIVYRLAEDRFMVVANASNAQVVSDVLAERLDGSRAVLDDQSLATGLVAVQGPRSADVMGPHTDVDLASLRYYGIADGQVAGIPAHIARTGYTGEDGFEIFVETGRTGELWDTLLDAVRAVDDAPVGLGARDTLRLEAGMPLYGNELDRATNPFEAGLGRVVKLDKPGDFIGREALARVARDGPAKSLVGMVVTGRGIARHGYPVVDGDDRTGVVTSGTHSPTLGKPIAMAYVAPDEAEPGTILSVEIREQPVASEVVPLPFYKRERPA